MKRRNTYVYNPSFAHSGLAKGRISDSDREIEDHRGPVARVESANVDLGGMGAPPRSRSLDLVPNDNWVHIALTVEVATADNGATATLYVNGAAQGPSFTGPLTKTSRTATARLSWVAPSSGLVRLATGGGSTG